jgi:photosystem II stability/assembly factor-like uncharacterized protein
MKRKWFATVTAVLTSMAALLVLLCLMGRASPGVPGPALAAPLASDPVVTDVEPSSAPNDLDTSIIITGTGFSAGLSGMLVITQPMAYLGDTALEDTSWVSTTTLEATAPWGMDPGVYTLTVVNPDGESGSLTDAFTVTQGFGVWNAGELYGGNINKIVINPVTPTTLYAIANDVGLFRSQDGGESWSFKIASVHVEDLAIDPVSPNPVYIVGYPHSGGWFYRSDDEGETWIPLTATFPITQTSGVDCWRRYRLHTRSGTVYATACGSGLTDTQVTALAFHPTDPLTMYLGTASGNIFISHNGGVFWTFASQPLGNVGQIAVSPFEPHEVWIATGWPWWSYPCGGLKSANAELTAWTPITGLGYDFCGDSPVLFAPETWGGVYSKTVFIHAYKTSDGGATWQPFGPGNSAAIRAVHPSDPDVIYSGHSSSSSGVHRTTNGGMTWELASQGLTGIFPWSLEVVPDQPDVVFAGTNVEAAFKGTGGGSAWKRLPIDYGGDRGGSIVVDPVTPTRVYAGAGYSTGLGVHISNDGGDTWPTFVPIDPPQVYSQCAQGVATLLPVPGEPGTLLAGVHHVAGSCIPGRGSIYRSPDYGEHWGRVYPTQPQESNQFSDLAYDALTSTIVYAAGYGDGMLRSTDAGLTWEPTGAGIPALDQVLSIAVEPGPPYRVFVITEGGLGAGLYLSEDHGVSWRQADSPMLGFNTEQIIFAPSDPPVLYAGAHQGLFRSTDGAQSWKQAAGVLGQVPVYSLAAAKAEGRVILYVGTTGGYVEGSTDLTGFRNLSGLTNGVLVPAGVYRWGSRLLNQRVYLPLILKGYAP